MLTDEVDWNVLICLMSEDIGIWCRCVALCSPGRSGVFIFSCVTSVWRGLRLGASSSSAQTNSTQLWTRITWHLLPQGQQHEMWVHDFLWSATRRSTFLFIFFPLRIPQTTPDMEEPKIYSIASRDFDNLLPFAFFSKLDIWSSVLGTWWTLSLFFGNHFWQYLLLDFLQSFFRLSSRLDFRTSLFQTNLLNSLLSSSPAMVLYQELVHFWIYKQTRNLNNNSLCLPTTPCVIVHLLCSVHLRRRNFYIFRWTRVHTSSNKPGTSWSANK